MRVNAGIKSKEEALLRLLRGEKFYNGAWEVSIGKKSTDPLFVSNRGLPSSKHIDCLIVGELNRFAEWEVEQEAQWYHNIPEGGIICEVWDDDPSIVKYERVIKYDNNYVQGYSFFTEGDIWWKHARPLTCDDVMK